LVGEERGEVGDDRYGHWGAFLAGERRRREEGEGGELAKLVIDDFANLGIADCGFWVMVYLERRMMGMEGEGGRWRRWVVMV